jgi:GntR family transcriptional repressor for pyruvate dehydrogenase complex
MAPASARAPERAGMQDNGSVPPRPVEHPRSGRPTRLHKAVFRPIGDDGRATLVERRIAEAIMGGVLPAGERLPAETELAQLFGVAPATAREALFALRERGLIVTRRGRNGGSFVTESADPTVFAKDRLRETSLVGLRDAAAHYQAITVASVALAARRADASEVQFIRARLERVDDSDLAAWRRASDDAQVELAALSQSARLTQEQMRLQAELSPYLALVDTDPDARAASRRRNLEILDAVAAADEDAAAQGLRTELRFVLDWLIDYRATLGADASGSSDGVGISSSSLSERTGR